MDHITDGQWKAILILKGILFFVFHIVCLFTFLGLPEIAFCAGEGEGGGSLFLEPDPGVSALRGAPPQEGQGASTSETESSGASSRTAKGAATSGAPSVGPSTPASPTDSWFAGAERAMQKILAPAEQAAAPDPGVQSAPSQSEAAGPSTPLWGSFPSVPSDPSALPTDSVPSIPSLPYVEDSSNPPAPPAEEPVEVPNLSFRVLATFSERSPMSNMVEKFYQDLNIATADPAKQQKIIQTLGEPQNRKNFKTPAQAARALVQIRKAWEEGR